MKARIMSRLLLMLVAGVSPYSINAQMERATFTIELKGHSRGGTLTLMKAPGWNYPYVIVTNHPGEPASVVAARLANALAQCSACAEWYGGNPVREVHDGTLLLSGCAPWIFGGTETGFDIPAPPTAVSVSYDPASDEVTINWVNPSEGYDAVAIVYYGSLLCMLPGNVTRYVHKRGRGIDNGFSSSDIVVFVMGYKRGVPSNGVGVRLRRHTEQEALMNVPFTAGVAPGFEAWRHNTSAECLRFEQGNLPGAKPATDVRQFEGKGFYQVINGRGPCRAGVMRRFIGLTAGHTYRVSARLNVLEASSKDWAFSFHAAATPHGKSHLTDAQLAGLEELPIGIKGSTAAQIARYDSTKTPRGQWMARSSGINAADNLAGDITLPAGTDSITVWFRLEGLNISETVVAFDSVTIEDLGQK